MASCKKATSKNTLFSCCLPWTVYSSIKAEYYLLGCLMIGVLLSGYVLSSSVAKADVSDVVTVTLNSSCTLSGTNTVHSDAITNGITKSDIGTTTLKAFCNDANGFSIYAIGYTSDVLGNNNLVDTITNSEIATSTTTGGNNPSSWAVKLITDPESTYPLQLQNDYNSYHIIPNDYELVATRLAGTDVGSSAAGSILSTTYQAYISPTQTAGSYQGKVKYILVHPNDTTPPSKWLTVNYDANGLYYNGDPAKTNNVVRYDAMATAPEEITEETASIIAYNTNGEFVQSANFNQTGGNKVITINGAGSIHITVTYGIPQNAGGPENNLFIWKGNHPTYTDLDAGNNDSITACGTTTATGGLPGAFYASGGSGSQVTMTCDIAGTDSVTFYDYGNGSNYSTGYYAVVTNDAPVYDKVTVSGTYATPTRTAGTYTFLGWSTSPDVAKATYADESEVIMDAPYLNAEMITLYAVWGGTMQEFASGAANATCPTMNIGDTTTLVDVRDGESYRVGKLRDGKCWMLENLNLAGGTALSVDDTDLTNDYISNFVDGNNLTKSDDKIILPASAIKNPDNNDLTDSSQFGNSNYAYVFNSGNKTNCGSSGQSIPCYSYYSWDAATLGSSRNQGEGSICPKGWRLPVSSDTNEANWQTVSDFYMLAHRYGLDSNVSVSEPDGDFYTKAGPGTSLGFLLAGRYNWGSFSNGGSYGAYWSSISHDSYSTCHLYFTPSYVGTNYSAARNNGFSVRCLVK